MFSGIFVKNIKRETADAVFPDAKDYMFSTL